MTSTGIYTGMENVAKPTSRVTEPPGGRTNFSLGGYGEDSAPAVRKQTSAETDAEMQAAQSQAQQDLYKPSPPQPIKPAEDSYANVFGASDIPEPSNNLSRGKRRYPERTDLGLNPVTGEPNVGGTSEPAVVDAPQPVDDFTPNRGQRAKPAKLDPASMPAAGGRVENKAPIKRQPPGGKDSGIFS